MNNSEIIYNINQLINTAIGYGDMTAHNDDDVEVYKNDLVNSINNLLTSLKIRENYNIININKNNVIPDFFENDCIWTDYIVVTKNIKDELISQKENGLYNNTLILKTGLDKEQELW